MFMFKIPDLLYTFIFQLTRKTPPVIVLSDSDSESEKDLHGPSLDLASQLMTQIFDVLSSNEDSETKNEDSVKQNIPKEENPISSNLVDSSGSKDEVGSREQSLDLATQVVLQLLQVFSSNEEDKSNNGDVAVKPIASNCTPSVTSISQTGDNLTNHTIGGNRISEVFRSPSACSIVIEDEDGRSKMERVET